MNDRKAGGQDVLADKSNQDRRCCLPPEQFITLATALAITLSQGLTTDEIDSLSNFFDLLSTQLAALSSQKSFCEGEGTQLIL